MTSDYAALIRDAIAYLKESSSPVFGTKEEWEALHAFKNRLLAKPAFEKKGDDFAESPVPCTSTYPIFRPSQSLDKKPIPTKEPVVEKKQLHLQEMPAQQQSLSKKKEDSKTNNLGIKSFLQHCSVSLATHIPDDAQAVRTISAHKEYIENVDVVIFACDADSDTLALIKNLSKSIDQKLAPVKILRSDRLESEQRWDLFMAKNPIKLCIASSGFSRLKNAMRYYTHKDGCAHSLFNDVPLIILSPCTSYMQSPKEKSILWNQICALLKR